MTVVRAVESRAHLVNPFRPDLDARIFHYAYEDPVADMRGRGFLGFRKFRVWDPSRPMETVSTFDNRTRWEGNAYLFAMRPTSVRTVVGLKPSKAWVRQGIESANARVALTTYRDQLQVLNGGKSYDDLPNFVDSKEWEEDVSIDWDAIDPDERNPTSEHMFGIAEPSTLLRSRYGIYQFDDFGNETSRYESTTGGARQVVDSFYFNRSPEWLNGLLRKQCVTAHEADPAVLPRKRCMEFEYGSTGLLETVYREKDSTDPSLCSKTTLRYDAYGLLAGVEQTAGAEGVPDSTRETRFEYEPTWPGQPNERVFPSQVWRPMDPAQWRPSVWLAFHPAYGVLMAQMDANGVQASASYDDLGRLVATTRDGEAAVALRYAGRWDAYGGRNGMVVTRTVGGRQVLSTRDALGREIKSTRTTFDGSQSDVDVTYDRLGRVTALSRPYPAGAVPMSQTLFTYDPLDRPLTTTLPDGTHVRREHGFFGSHAWDAANHESRIARDVDGRVVEAAGLLDGTPIATSYHYAAFGVVDRVTDHAGNETHVVSDLLGRIEREEDPNAGTVEYVYNGFDDVVRKTHVESGESTDFFYDRLGRATRSRGPDGETTLTWDAAPNGIGALAATTSPDAVETLHHHDSNGRPSGYDRIAEGHAHEVRWTYGPNGQLDELRYPSINGVTPGLILKYKYNAADYLQEIGDITTAPYERLWTVNARNLDDALLQGQYGNGFIAGRTYDPASGRLQTMAVTKGVSGNVYGMAYTYHANGLVKTRTDNVVHRQEAFVFDALSRLKTWDATYGAVTRSTEYDYDALGNMTQVRLDRAVVEQNTYGVLGGGKPNALTRQIAGGATTDYGYDTHGRQTQGGARAIPRYSDFDLPRQIDMNGSKSLLSYNALGERVKKTTPSGQVVYVGELYELREEGGKRQHVFHVHGQEGALAEITTTQTSTTTSKRVSYLATDALGSAGAVMGEDGTLSRLFFEPFGRRIGPDGAAFPGAPGELKRGFTGHEHDDELGLINLGGRLYDPAIKRMLTPDPHVKYPLFGQSWNAYSYVMNSPLDFTDPTGFDPVDRHADCSYFSDGCGTGLNDLIGTVENPADAVGKTTDQSVGYGSGALGWGTVGWANAGPAGVLQSGSEGYTEFGAGQMGRPSPLGPKGGLAGSKGDRGGGTSLNAKDPALFAGPWIRALGMSPGEIKQEADQLFAGLVEMAAWELGIGTAKMAVSVLRNLPRLAEATSAVIRAAEVVERPAEALSTGGTAARGAARTIDPNKLNHIFGKVQHVLDDFVRASGGPEQAFMRIQDAANAALREGKFTPGLNGILPSGDAGNIIDVGGTQIRLIGGRVVDGAVEIGSVSRMGLL